MARCAIERCRRWRRDLLAGGGCAGICFDAMQQARCDPFVWVRLEGVGGSEDLVVPLDESREEWSWLEERTSR
jgi:hypothetical protein